MQESIALIGIGIICAFLWTVLGIGVARMVAEINKDNFSLFHVLLWPISLCVFATTGKYM